VGAQLDLREKQFVSAGIGVAIHLVVPLDVIIGRWLACCAHPAAAWRNLPVSGRALLVAAYVSASYVVVLTALLAR
jgi:hypothetical protein